MSALAQVFTRLDPPSKHHIRLVNLWYRKQEYSTASGLFRFGSAGIGTWLTAETDDTVLDRLCRIDDEPLSKVQLAEVMNAGVRAVRCAKASGIQCVSQATRCKWHVSSESTSVSDRAVRKLGGRCATECSFRIAVSGVGSGPRRAQRVTA